MDTEKLKDLAARNPLVADAVAVLQGHAYVYGTSNTAKVLDPGKRMAIKAACRVIHEAELADLRPADGRNAKVQPRRAAELAPGSGPVVPEGRQRRKLIPDDCGPIPAAVNKVLRLLEDGLELNEVPAVLVHAAKVAMASPLVLGMSPALRAVVDAALDLAEPAVEAAEAPAKPRKRKSS